jgi:hypothetical protein
MSDEIQVQEAPAVINAPQIERPKRSDPSIDAQNKVAELRNAARAKVADMLREDRGVPQPAEQPKTRNTAKDAAKEPVIAAEKAVPSIDYAAMSAEFAKKAQAAEVDRITAHNLLEQAKREKQELRESVEQPLEFLKKAGYTVEEWQALLLSGGKESAEMKKAKEAETRAKKAEEAALKATEELKNYQRNVLKAAAIKEEISPALAEFPLASKLTTPDQLLEMIQKHYRETGEKLDPKTVAQTLEEQYEKQFEELLSDEKVAKKVGKGKVAARDTKAEAGPSTLSNRVTNTTSAKTKLATLEERRAAALQLLRDRGAI